MGCGQEIIGILKEGYLHISEMHLCGEGSGSVFNYILDNAFKFSKGYYEAVMVWEGGDSIYQYIVNNGVITETKINL